MVKGIVINCPLLNLQSSWKNNGSISPIVTIDSSPLGCLHLTHVQMKILNNFFNLCAVLSCNMSYEVRFSTF